MSKPKSNKSAAAKPAALTLDELQKLSPEEQLALINGANAKASEAQAAAEKATAKLKAAKPVKAKDEPMPSFEVDADKKNGVEGGTYEFTSRTFTHGGKVHKAAEVVKASESDDETDALAAQAILAALVSKKSGIIQLMKED